MIKDEDIEELKQGIADALNSGLPKSLRGKPRKKTEKANVKTAGLIGDAIWGMFQKVEVEVPFNVPLSSLGLSGQFEYVGTGSNMGGGSGGDTGGSMIPSSFNDVGIILGGNDFSASFSGSLKEEEENS